jgi:hypothetical protein
LRSKGLPAPAILAFDRLRGFFLLEDFGDLSLEGRVKGLKDPGKVTMLYQHLITLLIRIKGRAEVSTAAAVTTPLYATGGFLGTGVALFSGLSPDYRNGKNPPGLAENSAVWPPWWMRRDQVSLRDFQSRIAMAGNGGLIDFQAGRLRRRGATWPPVDRLWIFPNPSGKIAGFYISAWSQNFPVPRHFAAIEVMAFRLADSGGLCLLSRVKGKVYFEAYMTLSALKKRVREAFKPFVALKRLLEEL